MSDDMHQAVLDLYDEAVRSRGGEAVKTSDAKAAIHESVVELIRDIDRDLDREAELMVDQVIGSARQQRSRSLKRSLDHLLCAFDEQGAYMDPLLDQSFPLGDAAGLDKTLRNWTSEDFLHVAMTRFKVAAETTRAAAEFNESAERAIEAMRAAGADHFGDCLRRAA